jgi:acyl-homoserine lactone acylase PvdQ
VYGKTRADVEFGAGYATAEDRYVFMEQLRGPGRIAALDVPGIDPFALATSGRQFVPTQATDQRLNEQRTVLLDAGPRGRQFLEDATNYLAGINTYYRRKNIGLRPWTFTDAFGAGALLGANLGVGGGDESQPADVPAGHLVRQPPPSLTSEGSAREAVPDDAGADARAAGGPRGARRAGRPPPRP